MKEDEPKKSNISEPKKSNTSEATKSNVSEPKKSNISEQEKLDWIDTFDKLNAYHEGDAGLRTKAAAKMRENPFVPLGMIATTLALTVGVYQMRTGNKKMSQLMMRARVGAQGLTIAAIIIGVAVAAIKKKPNGT